MKETDVGAAVVTHLEREGWDVYQEVPFLGGCADVVVVRDGPQYVRKQIGVVECKVSLSFELMAQAWRWRTSADLVWIAAPVIKRSDAFIFARDVIRRYGFGYLEVQTDGRVLQREPPGPMKMHHHIPDVERFIGILRPQHKTAKAAGANRGSPYTEFRSTSDLLVELVRAEPGIRIHDAVLRVTHHYQTHRTAVSALRKYVIKGVIPQIEFRDVPGGKRGALYPKEEKRNA